MNCAEGQKLSLVDKRFVRERTDIPTPPGKTGAFFGSAEFLYSVLILVHKAMRAAKYT